MAESNLIQIDGLSKQYTIGGGIFTALKEIQLQVAAGDFLGLVGPSGSGKTTLLNIIGALDTPSGGHVQVLGKDIETLSASQSATLRKEKLGFIFQSYNLLPVYNVFENVEFPLLLLHMDATKRRQAVMEALDWVGLLEKEKSRPAQLSGGECQRVAIARAMVKKPEIVLADEPTANLDAANSHHILKTMQRLNRELKTTFLFATHDQKVIDYLGRKVSLMDGKIVADVVMDGCASTVS